MKTAISRRLIPFAVFVLGIAGAFSTVSMQSVKAEISPITGYVDNFDGGSPCDLPISCDDEVTPNVCRQFDLDGQQAMAKFPGETTTCTRTVYRPLD
ncbi:hypothetical protein ASE40_20530 [Flavobacterium sp. Root935]|jgi:hypothetical protein|uniref:hypothetical protein n=1 Tax=Flavobacterium sp. Root935 TaxID=1736610 RepID=UPI0007154AB5|nr:hypothetical protein [Flavobacterium sp. Root935]KRD58701.1 hypothetical protein ASE40_20530 [Flavobacterium sp. Root935]